MSSSNFFDRPILWSAFDGAWTTVTGRSVNDFEFIEGKSLLSTPSWAITIVVLYLTVILGGREYMRDRPACKLNELFIAHNFILSVASGSLLLLFAEQLVPQLWQRGLYENICGASGWSQPLVTLYFLNYIMKYYELLDTVFLFLKKKPLTFLHCYHHPATVLLCFVELVGQTSVSWVPIVLNLFVHVVMYWYYFQSARGVKVSWKQWITRLQILQFVIDLGFVYFATWDYVASTFAPFLPHVGKCSGEFYAAIAGCGILSSYLVLFIAFYLTTYQKKFFKRHATSKGSFRNMAYTKSSGEQLGQRTLEIMRHAEPISATGSTL